jgi:hypothetical protein
MGKRGPQPKGEYADKSAVLSTRISAELRASLENAAKASGLTLSREIEHRLRQTFQAGEGAAQMFGSAQNYRLAQLIGVAMTLRARDREVDWLSNPRVFLEVLRTVHHLLWQVRPPGTDEQFSFKEEETAEEIAEAVWAMIHASDATLPLGVSPKQHRANLIKSDLGHLVDRTTFRLTNYIPPPPAVDKPAPTRRQRRTHK